MPATHPIPESSRRLRLILCGYGHLGLALLHGVLEQADLCEVVGVFRWSTRPASTHCWEPIEDVFKQTIQKAGIRELVCPGVNSFEFAQLLEELRPDVLLVGSWGEIIKPHIIQRPDLMLVNCHPSKLPAHRGANPYSSVIWESETETGVTFHRIAPQIDTGHILLQETVPLYEGDTGLTVRDRCIITAYQMTPALIIRLAQHLLQGEPLGEQPQDELGEGSYFKPLSETSGQIDWTRDVASLWRQYRALFPWMPCYSRLPGSHSLKMVFYDPKIINRPPQWPDGHAPGTVLANQSGRLWIALSEPDKLLQVSLYQIQRGKGYWPLWVSRLLSLWLCRPGVKFQ